MSAFEWMYKLKEEKEIEILSDMLHSRFRSSLKKNHDDLVQIDSDVSCTFKHMWLYPIQFCQLIWLKKIM